MSRGSARSKKLNAGMRGQTPLRPRERVLPSSEIVWQNVWKGGASPGKRRQCRAFCGEGLGKTPRQGAARRDMARGSPPATGGRIRQGTAKSNARRGVVWQNHWQDAASPGQGRQVAASLLNRIDELLAARHVLGQCVGV